MKERHGVAWRWLGRRLRTQFLTGIIVIVPIGATIGILYWIFAAVDDLLQPVIEPILGQSIPGVGFGIMIVLIYLVGVIASNVVGRKLIQYGEYLLARVPLVRPLYRGIKQILESFSGPSETGLMQPVLIEFPRKGVWTIGFITNESPTQSGETQLSIFIPTAPNPMSGFLQIVPEKEIIRTSMSVDDALKMVISAGRMTPQEVTDRLPGGRQ